MARVLDNKDLGDLFVALDNVIEVDKVVTVIFLYLKFLNSINCLSTITVHEIVPPYFFYCNTEMFGQGRPSQFCRLCCHLSSIIKLKCFSGVAITVTQIVLPSFFNCTCKLNVQIGSVMTVQQIVQPSFFNCKELKCFV